MAANQANLAHSEHNLPSLTKLWFVPLYFPGTDVPGSLISPLRGSIDLDVLASPDSHLLSTGSVG
jgi:hypothetical protein